MSSVPFRAPSSGEPAGKPQVDLELHVHYETTGSREKLAFTLNASDPDLKLFHKHFPSRELGVELRGFFEDFFHQIEILTDGGKVARKNLGRRLASKATQLSKQILPGELCERLWPFQDSGRSLLICSSEGWIPWELLRLWKPRMASGGGRSSGYLCETFALSRWASDHPQHLHLPCRRIGVVVAQGELATPRGEPEAIARMAGDRDRLRAIAPEREAVLAAVASGFDCLHFAGHGRAAAPDPNSWEIRLSDSETLSPEDLDDEVVAAGDHPAFLLFLNGCSTGRSAMSLTRQGGWALAALEAGAGAFVGTLWSITDAAARDFAEYFYRGFLKEGLGLAEAVRQARRALAESRPGDPTWMAYTVFGHPLAVAQESPQKEVPAAPACAETAASASERAVEPARLLSADLSDAYRDHGAAGRRRRLVVIAALLLLAVLAGSGLWLASHVATSKPLASQQVPDLATLEEGSPPLKEVHNEFLTTQVLAASAQGNTIHLNVRLENRSHDALKLAINQKGEQCQMTLVAGSQSFLLQKAASVGLVCLYNYKKDPSRYTKLSAKSFTVLNLVFEGQEPLAKDFVTFSADLLRHQGLGYQSFSVGISDIPVQKSEGESLAMR